MLSNRISFRFAFNFHLLYFCLIFYSLDVLKILRTRAIIKRILFLIIMLFVVNAI